MNTKLKEQLSGLGRLLAGRTGCAGGASEISRWRKPPVSRLAGTRPGRGAASAALSGLMPLSCLFRWLSPPANFRGASGTGMGGRFGVESFLRLAGFSTICAQSAVFVAIGTMLSIDADAAEAAKGYDAFRLMRTRNIFDPNRKPVRVEAPRPSAPRTRSSSFTLTGTMVRDGRSLAFFSGTRSEFSKVIGVGDSVANYKIASIEPSQVELEHDGKKLTLAIGQPFKIEPQPGDPVEPDEPEDAAKTEGTEGTKTTDGTSAPATPGAPPNAPPPASGSGNSKDEIMRRMMERRAKEQGK